MDTPTNIVLDHRDATVLSWLRSRIFDDRAPQLALVSGNGPIEELATPELLCFAIPRSGDRVPAPAVEMGEEIAVGRPLAQGESRWISPVAGKVVGLRSGPDSRGGKAGLTVLVEPGGPTAPLPSLDPLEAPVEALRERLAALGATTDEPQPRPLLAQLDADDTPGRALVVLGADREPWLGGAGQLVRERGADAVLAARMLARIGGFGRVILAVLEPLAETVKGLADDGIEVLAVASVYPRTLPPMLLAAAGLDRAPIVGIEAALAALDAVRDGRCQSTKVVSVIGPGGKRRGELRVPLGTRIQDLLSALGMKVGARDKVVVGGPLRGFAQYSLETSVDHGTSGVLLLRGREVRSYTDEPCFNCGSCIDACPVRLQAHLLGRYAEFGLFDRTPDLAIDRCIECGLCAVVCPARRPLLQLIRLAKREVESQAEPVLGAEEEAA